MAGIERTATGHWQGDLRSGRGRMDAPSGVFHDAPFTFATRFEHAPGTNPEELLVCAVSSCFTATLFGVLRRAQLPVDSLSVAAGGTVTGFPGHARFARIVVSPTILGGDVERQAEYEEAADIAHYRCLIGRTLGPDVLYEVGSVRVQEDAVLPPARARELAPREHRSLSSGDGEERSPAWRAA